MATIEERRIAIQRAQQFQLSLRGAFPSFVKPMVPSQVSGGFWLGLPHKFCKDHLPHHDATITLVDFQGVEYHTIYISTKEGLSGGWRAFSLGHNLIHGDACVFKLTGPTVFRVYIFKAIRDD
ncbi:B3 domain-containing protein At5g42700-like [Papaver somniferum]|uniref:B3 domain-containing protein At5g42700-like n=1 Tax=Papaver somniferum TaxID=3469 RepID=UPI000E6F8404|nr:B3 domain-containing protein At5g42700-like [Papaver somniferum]